MTTNKIIGIDARFYGPTGKGLGRYTKEVVDRVIETDLNIEYIIFLSPENYNDFKEPNSKVKKILVTTRWYTIAEQFVLPYLIWRFKINLFHSPHFNAPVLAPCKLVITIHDLILLNFSTERATTLSSLKYKIKYLGYKFVIWLAVMRAKKIIAVSEFTKNDIISNFGIPGDKVVVTLEGVAKFQLDSQIKTDLFAKHRITQPFFIYIGNAYPHKNLEGLVSTYATMVKKQAMPKLVLVGREDYFYQRVKNQASSHGLWSENGDDNKIIFTGCLSDVEITSLFNMAIFYIFPSFYEGFGLPPLEAMAHGLPVLSSNQGSMPEILGEAAAYFNPYNQTDFISAIQNMISDVDKRANLVQLGFEQIKKYSWENCAQQTLEVYRYCL